MEFADANRIFDYEIIFVDNGSDDGSSEKLVEIGRDLERKPSPPHHVINARQSVNLGKGGAIRRGVEMASCDWILTIDADMATKPIQLLTWIADGRIALGSVNTIYIANRESGESVVDDKSGRRGLGRIFSRLVRVIVGLRIDDTQCGFKLYPRELARSCFGRLRHLGWAHDVEVLAHAVRMGAEIRSLPVAWKAVPDGKISLFGDSARMTLALFKIRADLAKRYRREAT